MAKLNQDWVVQPHGAMVEVDDGIWTVAGNIVMPLGKFPRRMTIVALAEGGAVIWSAIPLGEPEMARIEAIGTPRFLIVPNAGHRADVGAWHRRYPEAKIIAPPSAREAVGEAAPVDATDDIIGDPAIRFERIAGTKEDEFALLVDRGGRVTLILNDILSNVRHPEGIGANIMARLFGFGVKRPRTSRPVRRAFVEAGAAVAAQFRCWAALPGLTRIIVSHGDVIDADPAGALEQAASDYD
ncbi:MAG: hypothetical protein JNN10_06960 [Sphingopyxis sp.]|jgi:hypothetical protein|uniref:hypothetical protein n=1 Tax=Sphingopyxis sp. TaxID=1908224 RepID=UPI001A3CAEE1|nr:hypothetical protein [Sphingopyxis sp.]MBL9066015.1 hypothetical protein [Sphingopyxis sp.]HEV7343625.1 hypothetical protein [Sphingopyxis sp.]